jgi:hypothetical protein
VQLLHKILTTFFGTAHTALRFDLGFHGAELYRNPRVKERAG